MKNRVGRNEDTLGLAEKRELSSKSELEVSKVPISEKTSIDSSLYTRLKKERNLHFEFQFQ
jgi:hypothetical protein